MDTKWMPTVAGILNIVCGVCDLIGGIILTIIGFASGLIIRLVDFRMLPDIPYFVLIILAAVGLILIILGILALVGGIYALRRRFWGMALAGSIVSFFIIWPFGIASIIFTILSQKDFN